MSDEFLLRQFQQGTAQAATKLYLKYAERLRLLAQNRISDDLARRVDADDIVQSVFRTFFRRAALGEYEVPAGGDLWKLLLVMALNKIRSKGIHHRAARRNVGKSSSEFDEEKHVAAASEDDAITMLQLTVEELLGKMPEGHRQVIELRIEGYEVAEIAAQVQRSKRTVERILREFRDVLQANLSQE